MVGARVTFAAILAAIATAGPTQRISGGSEVEIEEIPFLAGVSTAAGGQHCGGTILTSFYVMTAARCVLPDLQVRVGSNLRTSGGNLIDVLTVIIHHDYDGYINSDIAVLGLAEPIIFDNPGVMQAPLPFQDMPVVEGVFGFIAGWGLDDILGSPSEQLQLGQVAVTSPEACTAFHQNPTVGNSIICASSATVDLCPGDSGGPLISSGMVRGVALYGSCGSSDHPSVYTNVANYSDWLVSVASGMPSESVNRNSGGLNLEVLRTR